MSKITKLCDRMDERDMLEENETIEKVFPSNWMEFKSSDKFVR